MKNIFGGLFKSKKIDVGESNFIIATLNDKIMPIDRGQIYEDPLDKILIENNYGEVSGGGTLQKKSGEIEYCDIEIKLNSPEIDKNVINIIITKLEEFGAPKGSVLNIEKTKEKISFGRLEGMSIFLDGINLSKNVYEECDVNYIIAEVYRLTNTEHIIDRYWESSEKGTGLYFYGESFEKMKKQIKELIESYPLCENCKIEQIA